MVIGKFSGRVAVTIGTALLCAASINTAGAAERAAKGSEIKPDLIYHNYCSVCHGDRGDGNSRARTSLSPPPKDFTKAAHLTREYLIAITTNGKPGTAMVGWKTQLNEREIEAVVDYIRKTFMQADMDPRMSRARTLFQQNCAACHGDRGQGTVFAQNTRPPRDFTSPQAKLELTRDRMVAAVTHGRQGTAMAGFGKQLPPQDIEAIVDYVRAAFMNVSGESGFSGTSAHGGRQKDAPAAAAKSSQAAGVDMNLAFPNGLKGDAAKGEKFYMDNCATCHGKKGDGKGPRAYFINPKPRNFLEPAARSYLNRPAIFAAVSMGSVGTEMPAWKFVMSEQEMANVSEFVFSRYIHVKDATKAAQTRK